MKDNTIEMSFKLGKDAKAALAREICTADCEDKTELHLKTINLVFSNETEEMEKRLIHSINEMDNGLEALGIYPYDLDDLALYDNQQQKYMGENTFSILSLVGLALLELGVITEVEEEE